MSGIPRDRQIEDWERLILDEQIAHESLYAGDTPLSEMRLLDAICAKEYRAKYSKDEMDRRLRWLNASYSSPGLPLSAVK